MNTVEILNKFPFFQQAERSFQVQLEETACRTDLEVDAYFFHEGSTCPHVALVGSGNIRVFKIGETGRQITLYHVQEGQTCLVNMLCAFLGSAAPATAVVETRVEALVFPAASFREWVRTSDFVRTYVFHTMALRLLDVMTLVEEIAFHKMDERLAGFLLQRFLDSRAPIRVISATHEEIAAELGSAREVISRLLKEFQRVGAIEMSRGRIELRDEQFLRHVSRSV